MDATLSESLPHPNPIPSAHHRKIELQSHADLTFLQQNLAKAAREKLDLHFPPIHSVTGIAAPATVISLDGPPSQPPPQEDADKDKGVGDVIMDEDEDPLRTRVRHLIDQFLQQTHTSAAPNVSVNGIDASSLPPSQLPNCSNPTPSLEQNALETQALDPSQEIEGIHYTYEAFDPRLQKRLGALHGELESLTAQVSKLRREAPKSAASAYDARLHEALRQDEEAWEMEQKRLQSETHTGLELELIRHGWNEDVREMYERAVNQLAVLSGVSKRGEGGDGMEGVSLTETVGRVQRARNVAGEFE
ncbi:hypothetical protein H2198_005303 [Neophaeococcomyces mojaviensis]|uniref:Uncharacterized protein n=1 Tax=Neophaeococcomyces mojaviensis TaxID=3383035 RepID=A0ACC3A647_9EURO|nr:hypothetical protein H2198_005303 [Knufia sp. JES_112]